MTTVAALARDGAVWMAADSQTNVYDRPIIGGMRKIRRYAATNDADALVGICGTGALAAVMDADLNLAEVMRPAPDDLDGWANQVARRVAAICISVHITDEGKMDGLLLLGYEGRVWTVTHCYAIPHLDGIAAIGSGEGPAVGAIDVLLKACPDMPPAEVVTRAVDVAIKRDKHSDLPIQLAVLPAREV